MPEEYTPLIPIFVNHNPSNCIGIAKFNGADLEFTFSETARVTKDQLFKMCDVECVIDEYFEGSDKTAYIRKATIRAFNLQLQGLS